jgi:poly(hydroxyalkanoate) depolymerase family esterase
MRRLATIALLGLLGLLVAPAGAASRPTTGERVHGVYPAAGAPGARTYALYVPAAAKAKPRAKLPLLVYLHGCEQTADDAAVGTRLEQLAAEKGVLVLFPEQLRPTNSSYPLADGNGAGCWNWFVPDHQSRGSGEPATLAGMTRDVMTRYPVDPRRVWLAGVSAGADMATILAVNYPELYTAVAPIAGCAFRTCTDLDGSAGYAAMGARARAVPAFIVQASTDMVNNAAMGATAVAQWLGTDDLADNGKLDQSLSPVPTVTNHDAEQGTPPGDPCVGSFRFPCVGGAAGLKSYPYSVAVYDGADGRSLIEVLVIHGANHAYTGGNPAGTFVDPVGPDLAHAMYDFFRAHPRR